MAIRRRTKSSARAKAKKPKAKRRPARLKKIQALPRRLTGKPKKTAKPAVAAKRQKSPTTASTVVALPAFPPQPPVSAPGNETLELPPRTEPPISETAAKPPHAVVRVSAEAINIPSRLKVYLEHEAVPYGVLTHREAYRASELAQVLHVPGKELAKVVILKVGERFMMTVLPANWKVDLRRIGEILHVYPVRLATEEECQRLFPDCELGAIPPFGNLYDLEVYVDQAIAADEEIVFPAGTRYQAVKLRYQDFARLVRPSVAEFHVVPSAPKTDS
jgi:Ala-tRNA(Pro) deacylase